MRDVSEVIRGEMSAVQSFDTVLEIVSASEDRRTLNSLREGHVEAVEKLKRCLGSDFQVTSTESIGPWQSFATSVTEGESFLADRIAIKALKIGEEYGANEYRKLLKTENLSEEVRNIIEKELLPQQERNLSTINGYLQ